MEVVRHPGSVVLLPMTAPNRILLVQQYRYVVDKWLWELPAGTREHDETLHAAALRECHEEVGKIAGRAEKLLSLFPSPGFCDEEMNFFLLTDLRDRRSNEAAPHQDPDELLKVKEFSVEEVREMVRIRRDLRHENGSGADAAGLGTRDQGLVISHTCSPTNPQSQTPSPWFGPY